MLLGWIYVKKNLPKNLPTLGGPGQETTPRDFRYLASVKYLSFDKAGDLLGKQTAEMPRLFTKNLFI